MITRSSKSHSCLCHESSFNLFTLTLNIVGTVYSIWQCIAQAEKAEHKDLLTFIGFCKVNFCKKKNFCETLVYFHTGPIIASYSLYMFTVQSYQNVSWEKSFSLRISPLKLQFVYTKDVYGFSEKFNIFCKINICVTWQSWNSALKKQQILPNAK